MNQGTTGLYYVIFTDSGAGVSSRDTFAFINETFRIIRCSEKTNSSKFEAKVEISSFTALTSNQQGLLMKKWFHWKTICTQFTVTSRSTS